MPLGGIDVTRELVVQSNDARFDGRNVVATDAQGEVEVRATPRARRDSVAGGPFPCTARRTIDGGTPVTGCARASWPAARAPSCNLAHVAPVAVVSRASASSRTPESC